MADRPGMLYLVDQVRQLAACGSNDYAVGGITYWTDAQIIAILDRTRIEIWDEQIVPIPQVNSGGVTEYREYRLPFEWLEQTTGGTAVFYLREADGTRIGTASYTVDYQSGRVTFGADQAGSARYVTARSYDVYAAAAMVWEAKAAHVAHKFDFQADGSRFDVSQQRQAYLAEAQRMWAMSPTGGVRVSQMERSDLAGGW